MRRGILGWSVIILSGLTASAAAQMADCDYKTRFFGTNATLQVVGGKPVGYFIPSYTASNVYMDGDTIFIDQATLSAVVYGKTSEGKPAIQGNWRLGSNRKQNVVFVCN